MSLTIGPVQSFQPLLIENKAVVIPVKPIKDTDTENGEIASEYIFDDEGNAITTALSEYGEVPVE